MKLDYHRTTFDLLQCEPIVSKRAVKQLDSVEKALGVRLPASIREWYSLEDAVERLHLADDPLQLEPSAVAHNAKYLKKAERRSRYLWVIGEYSSGVYFAVSFPGEADPIVRCIETDGSPADDVNEWLNRPFSAFVFTCCWYNLEGSWKMITGTTPSFCPPQIDMLIELFDEGPRLMRGDAPSTRIHPITRQGLLPVYRFQFFFFGRSGMIHLQSQDDPTVSPVEVKWTLSSPDEATLKDLASRLRARGIFPE